jgi:hypothetical protein
VLGLAGVLLLLAAGCGGSKISGGGAGGSAAVSPPQLKSIGQLQRAFNTASREPTLVVLISPT